MKDISLSGHGAAALLCGALWGVLHFAVKSTVPLLALLEALCLVWLLYAVLALALGLVRRSGHFETGSAMLQSIGRYGALLVSIFWGLSILGVNTTALLAAAGVVTLVIGFGAQSLIEDVLTGLFILFEGEYKIGDILVLGSFRGRVVEVGVRTTVLEDGGGNRQVINNSDIRNFQNRSMNESVAVSDIAISYDQDLRQLEALLQAELPQLYESHKDLFLEAPVYRGIEEFQDSGILLRFTVRVTEANVFSARRQLNRELKLLFDRHGIEIPFPQMVVHSAT